MISLHIVKAWQEKQLNELLLHADVATSLGSALCTHQ